MFGLFFLLLLCSCGHQDKITPNTISVPENGIYELVFPKDWTIVSRSRRDFPQDTTLPFFEAKIGDDQNSIRITLHYFPEPLANDKIKPIAQVRRWKTQFSSLDPLKDTIQPVSFNGFQGFKFEASGIQKGEETKVIAFALELGAEHALTLRRTNPQSAALASVTIKAVGAPSLIDSHLADIISFAKSFQLVEDLPWD